MDDYKPPTRVSAHCRNAKYLQDKMLIEERHDGMLVNYYSPTTSSNQTIDYGQVMVNKNRRDTLKVAFVAYL